MMNSIVLNIKLIDMYIAVLVQFSFLQAYEPAVVNRVGFAKLYPIICYVGYLLMVFLKKILEIEVILLLFFG